MSGNPRQDRGYQDENGSYVLPNDAQEHDRLDAQSKAFIALMHDKPFHAPLGGSVQRILDIGCGTGSMSVLLARLYPEAEVIGLDIAPVPHRHEQPRNLTFVQGDVMDVVRGNDPRFANGSFDYIFHRLLLFGVTDWPGYIQVVEDLLRPGGWTEMHDSDLTILSAKGENVSDNSWWFMPYLQEDCKALGLDVRVGRKLASLMRAAGLADASESVYELPHIVPDDMYGADLIRESVTKTNVPAISALVSKVCGGRRSAEMVEKMRQSVAECYDNCQPGDHVKVFAVIGQKVA